MTPEEAVESAERLNKTGKFREDWYYYPTYSSKGKFAGKWFVMRRRKMAEIAVAMYADGNLSTREE